MGNGTDMAMDPGTEPNIEFSMGWHLQITKNWMVPASNGEIESHVPHGIENFGVSPS
jgi:hypothetical protein